MGSTASPLWELAFAALLVLPGAFRPASRVWLLAFLATLALFLGLWNLPRFTPGERILGDHWNWSGALLALAGTLWVAARLARGATVPWREMGFTWDQRPGSLRPALWVCAAALSLNVLVINQSNFRLHNVPLETWLYQATLPGLFEEAAFRGVLLALLDRAFGARRSVLGISVGWGGVVVTLVFVGLHGVTMGTLLGVLPAALLYLWLRVRTGSLIAPVVVHNLWNLSVYAAHL
jgi:membrane protease YdiL (CAAX protease family)